MTKYDYNFAKLDENGALLFCPIPLAIVIHHHEEGIDPETGEHYERDWDERRTEVFPTAEDKARMGYLPLVDEPPTDPAPAGKHYERQGWALSLDGQSIVAQYALVDDPPPPPRRFSKLRLYTAIVQAGFWEQLEEWLKTQTVEGLDAYTAFLLAQDISDDHPLFTQLYTAAKVALDVDDTTAELILAAAEEEA